MTKRLSKYDQETMLFILDFDVPFTNNLPIETLECQSLNRKYRELSEVNTEQRLLLGFGDIFLQQKKKGKNIFDGLVSVFTGEATDYLYSDTLHA